MILDYNLQADTDKYAYCNTKDRVMYIVNTLNLEGLVWIWSPSPYEYYYKQWE